MKVYLSAVVIWLPADVRTQSRANGGQFLPEFENVQVLRVGAHATPAPN
jgi:hypothetical protein